MKLTDSDIARFWAKVDRRGPDECWEWVGTKRPNGYGSFSIRGRGHVASRLACELSGRSVDKLCACHHCDNPSCVNPSHLFVGTSRDNAIDKTKKGRNNQSKKTHCPYGHPYADDNLYTRRRPDGNNERNCRVCSRDRQRVYNRKSRAKKRRDKMMSSPGRAKKAIVDSWPHPGNGKCVGGCAINSTLVRLDCGHVKSFPSSRLPKRFAFCGMCGSNAGLAKRLGRKADQ